MKGAVYLLTMHSFLTHTSHVKFKQNEIEPYKPKYVVHWIYMWYSFFPTAIYLLVPNSLTTSLRSQVSSCHAAAMYVGIRK